MFSRAASLRRFAASGASLLRPAAAAPVLRSSPLSTTAKRAPKKKAVPAPEPAPAPAPAPAPQQAARDRPLPPRLDPSKVKRPTEVPFKPEDANTVHLVGTVGVMPVREEKSPGQYQAVSVIVEKEDLVEKDSLQLWIPVIFQGDLAEIALCHLKENDLIYIVGHLSGGEETTKVVDAHSKIRIFARSLSFVESNSRKDDKMVSEQDKMASRKDDKMVSEHDKKMASDHSAQENSRTRPLWNDLLSNPHNWWDNRATMTNPSSAAFKHKDKGHLLWLNEFIPEDILSKLDTLAFCNNTPKKSEISGNVKDENSWTDVFANPGDWKDNRIDKQNGTVSPRYPDFNHKSSGQALWLGSAPGWVQSKLDGLNPFGSSDLTHVSTSKNIYDVNDGKKTLLADKEKDAQENSRTRPLWNDLLSNPHNWWDNRATMANPSSAAFKHKDKGQLLWLNEFTPKDVLSKLDTLAFCNNTPKKSEISGNDKDESSWTDVFANPGDWKDNRIDKQNGTVSPRYPDFKHKSSGQALWLGSAPGWVQSKLDGLNPFGSSDLTHDSTSKNIYDVNDGNKTLLPNKKKDEDLWKDVIENPIKWWDNRSDKRNPRAPDFCHKESGDALWLDTSPSWVREKLQSAQSTTNSEDLWKDVIENPIKWWDNRLDKRYPKSPDFKHKDSGEGLWLSSSPSWVQEKLAPAESTRNTDSRAKATILS